MNEAIRSLGGNYFKEYAPYIFYGPILVVICTICVARADRSPLGVVALLATGLLSWGLIEYLVHRFVLHSRFRLKGFRLPGNITHLRHHAHPQDVDRLHVALSESIPVSVVYCALAWAVLGSWQAVVWTYTGMMAGYFFYEFLDHQAHHGSSRNRLVRYFCEYHLQHHHEDALVRYGVTSPLFDYLFGTYHLRRKSARSRLVGNKARVITVGRRISTTCPR